MKKIAIIGIVGIPANYGGFESFTEQLVQQLRDRFDITVYCQKSAFAEHPEVIGGVHLKYMPLKANGVLSVPYDVLSVLDALRYADSLLILGVGSCPMLPFLRLLFPKKHFIVNIDGLEWRRKKWTGFSRHYLRFGEICAAYFATTVAADNQVVADHVWDHYRRKCSLIEYGADNVPLCQESSGTTDISDGSFAVHPFALAVCRIVPENNVDIILEAFRMMKSMRLVVVGNWNSCSYSRQLHEKYASVPNITLMDPVYDLKKLNHIRENCTWYLHGHSCGGTNPSLVEAMYLKLPVVAYGVSFNRETTENKALYFMSSEELCTILQNTDEAKRLVLADSMKEIADRRYTWKRIAQLYAELF